MDTVKICAVTLVAAICFALVRRVNSSFDMPMRLGAAIVLLGIIMGALKPLFAFVLELIGGGELWKWQGILFSAMGVAFLSHITAELCRDCGEAGLGGYCETVGKIEILLLCLPLIKELLGEVESLVP